MIALLIIVVPLIACFVALRDQEVAMKKIADDFSNGKLPRRGKNVIFRA